MKETIEDKSVQSSYLTLYSMLTESILSRRKAITSNLHRLLKPHWGDGIHGHEEAKTDKRKATEEDCNRCYGNYERTKCCFELQVWSVGMCSSEIKENLTKSAKLVRGATFVPGKNVSILLATKDSGAV